jgi:hypothetical protein
VRRWAVMADRTIVVARRFRGPDTDGPTGNGGYFCGRVARAAPAATTIEIRSRAGIPLERPLTVRVGTGTVEVLDDGALVARSAPDRLAVRAPAPPPLEVALEASRRFEARLDDGSVRHPFPECFVCGPRRAPGGLRLFAGPLPGDDPGRGPVRVAGWQPDPRSSTGMAVSVPSSSGPRWIARAAGPCPAPGNTGTLQVEIREPVDGRRGLIVMGWRAPAATRVGSRRRHAGTAMFDGAGRLLALGAAIWVAPDPLAGPR